MEEAEEAALDIAASAKAGLEKTKAFMKEKIEKMRTSDPVRIKEAEDKKIARIQEAERVKQKTMGQNEAIRHHNDEGNTASNTTCNPISGAPGYTVKGLVLDEGSTDGTGTSRDLQSQT